MAAAAATAHAGIKRKPSDIGDHERLAKRFEVLNLGMYYDAVRLQLGRDADRVFSAHDGHKHYLPVPSQAQQQADQVLPPTAAATSDPNGLMEVEDTKHRLYIHDLDKELADIESDEEHPIFLPDIDKHLNKLPRRLLEGREPSSTLKDKQLVLYHVPTSISLPKEDDNVRKVLIESRNRARLEQRAKLKKEQRGEMDVEDPEEDEDKPKRVFAHLKWKDQTAPSSIPEHSFGAPMIMHMEDADESTPEQIGPDSPDFTVEEMPSDDEDAMDLG